MARLKCVQLVGKDQHRCGHDAIEWSDRCHLHDPAYLAERHRFRDRLREDAADAWRAERLQRILESGTLPQFEEDEHSDVTVEDPSIYELLLSTRSFHLCEVLSALLGIQMDDMRASHLSSFSEADLLRCKNFGRKNLNEVIAKLAEHGYKLKTRSNW